MTYNVIYRDGTREVVEDVSSKGYAGIAKEIMKKYYPSNFYAEEVGDYTISNFAVSGWQKIKYYAIFESKPVNQFYGGMV